MSLRRLALFNRTGAALATSYPSQLADGEEYASLSAPLTWVFVAAVTLSAGQSAIFKFQGTQDDADSGTPKWVDLPSTRLDTITTPTQIEHTINATGAVGFKVETGGFRALRALAKVGQAADPADVISITSNVPSAGYGA